MPALFIAVILLPIFSAAHAADSEVLRPALSRSPLPLPIYIAQNTRYVAAEGLTMDFIGSYRAMQAMLDGTAIFAMPTFGVIRANLGAKS